MGIALTTFSALSGTLRTLTHWLHTFKEPSAADLPAPRPHPDDTAPGRRSGSAGTDKPRRPSNIPSQRPPRGNWPFTVSPQTPPTCATTRFVATNTDARAFIPSPAATRVACGSSRLADGSGGRAAKVLRRVPTSGGSGRLVIAGRMADVCAELDRLAASEAALQAC
ncbi:hypothetical protein [Acidovorax sp. LjRoot38]|uniref:hypothetical protein n=1 Tax=Acidovorax sp. LjRoot38 TaxID=3342327 RepID=UPI003F5022CD